MTTTPTHTSTTDGSVAYVLTANEREVTYTISPDGPVYKLTAEQFARKYEGVVK